MTPVRSSLVALSAMAGLACAEIDHPNGVAVRKDAGGLLPDVITTPNPLPCQAIGQIPLSARLADVLVVLDRSGTMDTAFGSGSRYQALAAQLSDLVTTYQGYVRFGYMEMPSKTGCENQSVGCCVSSPTVDLAMGNAFSMTAAIAAAAPVGGHTPTASALLAARTYYDQLDDGVDNRYVLLATDGVPNCTLSGLVSDGTSRVAPACQDALVEVEDLVSSGVRLIVLAVGGELTGSAAATSCLDALAHAGGAALSPGSPGYYSASDPVQLQLAIERIFGAVGRPSCLLPIPLAAKQSLISVRLDGQEIPEVPNAFGDGWCRKCPPSSADILITGAYCDRIQRFQVSSVDALYAIGCENPPPP